MESLLINTLIMFSVINQQQHVCAVKRDTSFFTAYFQQQLKKTDISLKTAPRVDWRRAGFIKRECGHYPECNAVQPNEYKNILHVLLVRETLA